MQRVILHPSTRAGYSSPPFAALASGRASAPARRVRVRQPIVSAAIVIYRPDDLWFRLHRSQRRYRTVPGRPELSGDPSARDRSYILADDSTPGRFTVRGIIARCIRESSSPRPPRRIVMSIFIDPYLEDVMKISAHARAGRDRVSR